MLKNKDKSLFTSQKILVIKLPKPLTCNAHTPSVTTSVFLQRPLQQTVKSVRQSSVVWRISAGQWDIV